MYGNSAKILVERGEFLLLDKPCHDNLSNGRAMNYCIYVKGKGYIAEFEELDDARIFIETKHVIEEICKDVSDEKTV